MGATSTFVVLRWLIAAPPSITWARFRPGTGVVEVDDVVMTLLDVMRVIVVMAVARACSSTLRSSL